jgi:hypothetical protein
MVLADDDRASLTNIFISKSDVDWSLESGLIKLVSW